MTTAGYDAGAYGIAALTFDVVSPIDIENSGDIAVTARDADGEAVGIFAQTADNSSIEIVNSGRLRVRAGNFGIGIDGLTTGNTSPLSIVNSGDFAVTARTGFGTGIQAFTYGRSSPLSIENKGNLAVTSAAAIAFGINTYTANHNSPISIFNIGDLTVSAGLSSYGISAVTEGNASPIAIVNSAKITADTFGIYAYTGGAASPIAIFNGGVIDPEVGISVTTLDPDSPITVENSGSVNGDLFGIKAFSPAGTTIISSGKISAGSLLAIASYGPGDTKIFNSGLIVGYILLDADDTFVNQNGGVFETKLTSDFGPGSDLFRNEAGGRVQAATNQSSFVNLERFENKGFISLQDGQVGDVFQISNTVRGTDLDFVASGQSTLAVDASLGPSSASNTFIIYGDVSGKTALSINVDGNVKSDAFFMPKPFDSGLFDWDLHFVETGSGFFELRSFPGAARMCSRSSSPPRKISSIPPTKPGSTAPPICVCCSMAACPTAPAAASSAKAPRKSPPPSRPRYG